MVIVEAVVIVEVEVMVGGVMEVRQMLVISICFSLFILILKSVVVCCFVVFLECINRRRWWGGWWWWW